MNQPNNSASPLRIYFSTHEVLHQKSAPVESFDDALKCLLRDMHETVLRFNGVGIAANQVGIPIRAFVVDSDNCLKEGEPKQHGGVALKVVNPVILRKSEETYEPEEGCMSLPSVSAKVVRHKWVDVEYFDENGKKQTIEKADGLLGQCFQHEFDHIEGIIITNYSSQFKRDFLLKKVSKYVRFRDVYQADNIVDARVAYKSLL